MMDDLISRKAAIDALYHVNEYNGRSVEAIRNLPSVQPKRKKGRWMKMSDADGIYYACSECGEDIPRVPHYNPQFDLFPQLKSIEKTNFCPNCGADMRGEQDD